MLVGVGNIKHRAGRSQVGKLL